MCNNLDKNNINKKDKNNSKITDNFVHCYKEEAVYNIEGFVLNKNTQGIEQIAITTDDDKKNNHNLRQYREPDSGEANCENQKLDKNLVSGYYNKNFDNSDTRRSSNVFASESYDNPNGVYEREKYNKFENKTYNTTNHQTIADRLREQKINNHCEFSNNFRNPSEVSEQTNRDKFAIEKNKNANINRNYDYSYYQSEEISLVKPLIIGTFSICLLILSFLVYRINLLSSYISKQELGIVEIDGKEYNFLEILSENQNLEKKIVSLEEDINSLQEVFSTNTIPNPSINTSSSANKKEKIDSTPYNQNLNNDNSDYRENSNVSISNNTEYMVQVGDTLSRISQKFYGNKNEFQKIKDANNLLSDNLKEGQVLVIPK